MRNIMPFFVPPDFSDEEKNRVAGILNIIALSVLSGFIVLFLPRVIIGQFQLFVEILTAGALITLSIVFLRLGLLRWAENILLFALLGFIIYVIFLFNGIHSIALLGIPICLVFAGIALRGKYFYAFTVLTILSVVAIGVMEISGLLVNPFSKYTTYLDVIDITVLVGVTAIAVRTLVENIFRSMHEAKASERAIRQQTEILKESEEQFRTLTEELPNMVYIVKHQKIIYVNEKCKELIGFSREEMYASDFDVLSIIAPEYRDTFEQKNRQLMNGEEVEPYECVFMSKGDDRIECFQTSKLIHYEGEPAILGLVIDLTEVKLAQEEVRESQSRLSSIFASAQEAIITLDEREYILSFNPAAEEMFRCDEHEALSQHITRFISFQPIEKNREVLIDSYRKNQFSLYDLLEGKVHTIQGIRVNGEGFLAEASISKGKVGHENQYTIILRDITERLKSEERHRDLQTQLLQSQKMEAVGALAGGIAHDFNNLLSVIIGNAELIKLKLESDHAAVNNIDEVLNASEQAQELVQQILAFSRKQEPQLRPIRLHYILREGMKLLRASIPTTIDIHLELPQNGPLILGDATQLHQVLMNLCTNAAYAMHSMNGQLTVRQKEVEFDDRAALYHPDLTGGQYAMFTVQDTGCGMDGFTLKRIFEPFFTTKDPGKGTGLGLSIVHSIIKSHNGAIKIRSEKGKGTQVDVYLPVFNGEEESIQLEKQRQEKKGNGEKIIIIDDEQQLLDTLSEILTRSGYEPIPFLSSTQALQVFESNPNNFDLVITDQTMPNMTGVFLAHRIRNIRKDLPIILMTGYDQLEDPQKLEDLGIQTIILKPFKRVQLSETIRKVLKKTKH